MCIRDSCNVIAKNLGKCSVRTLDLQDFTVFGDFYSLWYYYCLLYTSDAADERSSVDLGGRRIIKKKKKVAIVGATMHIQIETHKYILDMYKIISTIDNR